ncbi:hypothetical protein B0J13DRAFT_630994 [Dactylonectria estremocensis]|uniref:Uncharacterized protein n=1 Tax=Dactylonectria estremocensis TaxID=1079267 RepID=A0A9P9IC80_9HYPO|nr:hypothetical protein B0J13DRAFT_630994 [Dactylonectria estremocensis]
MAGAPLAASPFELGPRTPQGLQARARDALLTGQDALLRDDFFHDNNAIAREHIAFRSSPPLPGNTQHEFTSDAIVVPSSPTSEAFRSKLGPSTNPIAPTAQKLMQTSRDILNEKLRVFSEFCTAFDEIAAKQNSPRARAFATNLASGFLGLWTTNNNEYTALHEANTHRAQSYRETLTKNLQVPVQIPLRRNPRNPQGPPNIQNAPPTKLQYHQQQQQQQQQQQRSTLPPATRDDDRIFIRLDPGTPAWEIEPYALRKHITSTLKLSLSDIPAAKRCASGWALTPASASIKAKILKQSDEVAREVGAHTVEPAAKWHTYIIEGVQTPEMPTVPPRRRELADNHMGSLLQRAHPLSLPTLREQPT